MASVSGACSVENLSGMVSVREDVTPSTLEWKLIDQKKSITIPLNSLSKLQATKDTVAAMKVKVFYKPEGGGDDKAITLVFSNRPTMNNIKDALQVVVNRIRSVAASDSTPAPGSTGGTPAPSLGPLAPAVDSLLDASLLKNFELQQKLLNEDRDLRNVFANLVLKGKLQPTTFWLTRINLLRTYALTISQHRGPYNVLSTIKPVATSDNKVNVNVTRETINEIFDTYPTVQRAFNDLVPEKFSEGEFWLRFFNSKLFRRLRGDKINTTNNRGDAVLDKYLYLKLEEKHADANHVTKFIDIQGNQDDNSQRLGNAPDMTMKYIDEEELGTNPPAGTVAQKPVEGRENEMILLMKNMNKLLSKMVNMVKSKLPEPKPDSLLARELAEQAELELHDLQDAEPLHYIKLNIHPNSKRLHQIDEAGTLGSHPSAESLREYLRANRFAPTLDLRSTYTNREQEIEMTNAGINALVKHNFRVYRMLSREKVADVTNIVPDDLIQEIITFNITVVELLSHFWKIFLHGNQPVQLKEIFRSLRLSKEDLEKFRDRAVALFKEIELLKDNDKLQDRIAADFNLCIEPMLTGLTTAQDEYMKAVRAYQAEIAQAKESADSPNANGKRPLIS